MKNIALFLLIIALSSNATAQNEGEVTTFHRMLIFNKDKKLLVTKFKNNNLWVTPGLYQNHTQAIKQGIDSIASTYGVKVSNLKLRGIYGLKIPSKNIYSIRNIFYMNAEENIKILPENIDEYKWLSIEEVVKVINIPHINDIILDLYSNPNNIRSGTLEMKVLNNKRTSKIIEEFYSIN